MTKINLPQRTCFAALIGCCLVSASMDAWGGTRTTIVRGKVTCAEDGRPMPGVTVMQIDDEGFSMTEVTDENGEYVFIHSFDGFTLDCDAWLPVQGMVPANTAITPMPTPPAKIPEPGDDNYELFQTLITERTPEQVIFMEKDFNPQCAEGEANFCWEGIDFQVSCPEPSNLVIVDFSWTGTQTGSASEPIASLQLGVFTLLPGGEVRLADGDSPETLRIDKPLDLKRTFTSSGTARVGVQPPQVRAVSRTGFIASGAKDTR